jgi:hypothetical protein
MRRAGTAMLATALLTAPAIGDDAADFNAALGRAATGAILANAYLVACAKEVPDQAQAQRDAAAGWAHRVDLAGYYRLLDGAMASAPGLQDDLAENAERAQGIVDHEVALDAAPCHDLRSALADSEVFDIASDIRYLLRNADDFGIAVAEPAHDPIVDSAEVLPLARLSAQIAAKMDEIGSKDSAREDRDLREAREEHATEWLEQSAALAIFGRVVADDELREWRGDQQSSFLARCASFAAETHEAAMAADIGEDTVISGTIRWLREDRIGGVVSLNDCRVLGESSDAADLVNIDDDSPGLMLRPPAYEEAYAGPGQGIAMRDVDRVLYDAEFSNRLDGFGNGYTDRREDIYVLLRDGTAYRHEWNFAFTDLNLALSREREPDRWFSWNDSWGTVTLTQTGGLDEGETVALSKARQLAPVPEGQRLEATYYYLNVGMGGGRSDRDYAFSANGQVVHTRGGFVAGSFGTSYIIAVGEDDVTQSTYRFDGFTLLIDGPEGQERHFVALLDGGDADKPEEVIIGGRVYWLREGDE